MNDARMLIAAAAITAAVALAGCASDFEKCQGAGFTPGSSGMAQCLATQQRKWEAFSRSMDELGASAARASQMTQPSYQYAPPPVQCYSQPNGRGYETLCY